MTAQLTDAPGARAQAATLRLRAVRDRLRRLQDGEASTADDVRRARRRAEAQVRAVDEARRRLMHADRRAAARQIERRQMAATFAVPDRAASEQAARTDAQLAQLARLEDGITSLLVWRGGDQSSDPDRRHAWAGRVVDRITRGTGHDWLGAVCLAAASHLPIRGAAIAVRSRSTVDVTAASDRWAADAQDLELVLGEGPATTAHAECRVVDVADVADDSQPDSTWIAYATAASSHGVSALRAVPLLFQGVGLGTLTLFCAHPNEPMGQLTDEIAALAEVASVALLADVESIRLGAPDSLQLVPVATGLLAARLDIPFDDAMARLRAHAFSTGRTLSDVAEALLDSGWQDPQSGLADF